jgi:paraquat-inducible protein A
MMRVVHRRALAATVRGADRWLGLALAGALGLLVLGWTWPMMTIHRLVWLEDQVSLLDATAQLYRQGDWLLFAALAVFAILFPLAKLLAALWIFLRADATRPGLDRALDWLDLLGRWSMLDVFVAALLVVGIKASLISEVTLHAGLYLFAAAVVLSIAATQRLRVLARRARAAAPA